MSIKFYMYVMLLKFICCEAERNLVATVNEYHLVMSFAGLCTLGLEKINLVV